MELLGGVGGYRALGICKAQGLDTGALE